MTADARKAGIENATAGGDLLTLDELDLLKKFQETLDRVNKLSEDLVRFNDVVIAAQGELIRAQKEVRDLNSAIDRTEEQLAAAEAELDQHVARLRQVAVMAYIGGGSSAGTVSILLSSQTVDDLSKSRIYADAVADDQQEAIDRSRELRDQVSALRERESTYQNQAVKARDSVAAQESQLEVQRYQKAQAQQQETTALQEKAKLISEIDQKKLAYVQRIRGNPGGSIESLLRTAAGIEIPPSDKFGIFMPPVRGYRITQLYGGQIHPLYGVVSFHPGLDMALPTGEPIRAAGDGIVLRAGDAGDGYGNSVIIHHGHALGTLYGHASRVIVQPGQIVKKGDVIAFVGTTGYSTGPHLHWEVRVRGETDNPLLYMGTDPGN